MRPDHTLSADGADFIDTIVAQKCPKAVRVADPFHVVSWATDALDEVRRETWNDARALARQGPKRGRGRPRADGPPRLGSERTRALKGARYSLWKNPENLTENQQVKLAWIAATDPRLYLAPTCSKRACGWSSSCPTTRPSRRWTSGSVGRAGAASRRS